MDSIKFKIPIDSNGRQVLFIPINSVVGWNGKIVDDIKHVIETAHENIDITKRSAFINDGSPFICLPLQKYIQIYNKK